MSAEISLLFGTEMSKDDLVKNVSDALIDEHAEKYGQMLSQIENENNADD